MGPPVWGLVLDPLVAFDSTTIYIYMSPVTPDSHMKINQQYVLYRVALKPVLDCVCYNIAQVPLLGCKVFCLCFVAKLCFYNMNINN